MCVEAFPDIEEDLMPSPFPGMDPFLEAPDIWRGFHHSLADEIKAQLNAVLSPRYYADVDVRTVLEEVGIATVKTVYPDAAVLETRSAVPAGATLMTSQGEGYMDKNKARQCVVQRVLATLVLLLLALPAIAQQQELTAADHTAIHTVIEHQLTAFRNDDAAGAFAFASPAIQAKFGTPEQFMTMVQTAYQAVYRPRHVAFKELRMVEGVPTQEVLLVGPDGVPVLALYMLQKQPNGAWKIDGCYLMSFKGEQL
jgi:hypothetical protein